MVFCLNCDNCLTGVFCYTKNCDTIDIFTNQSFVIVCEILFAKNVLLLNNFIFFMTEVMLDDMPGCPFNTASNTNSSGSAPWSGFCEKVLLCSALKLQDINLTYLLMLPQHSNILICTVTFAGIKTFYLNKEWRNDSGHLWRIVPCRSLTDAQTAVGEEFILSTFPYEGDKRKALTVLKTVILFLYMCFL